MNGHNQRVPSRGQYHGEDVLSRGTSARIKRTTDSWWVRPVLSSLVFELRDYLLYIVPGTQLAVVRHTRTDPWSRFTPFVTPFEVWSAKILATPQVGHPQYPCIPVFFMRLFVRPHSLGLSKNSLTEYAANCAVCVSSGCWHAYVGRVR